MLLGVWDRCKNGLRRTITVKARARVLDAVVLENANLLGDDVHLRADLGADLHQDVAVMCADALGLGQLVANDVSWQRRVKGECRDLGVRGGLLSSSLLEVL